MKRTSVDILISGGGLAGMIAAAAFASRGFSVVCVEPNPFVVDQTDQNADLRSTAFLQPARNTLINTCVWDALARYATPLEIMRLADAGGAQNEIRTIADFNAIEISDEPFAWNLPNWLLRRELHNLLVKMDNVTLVAGQKTGRVTARTDHAIVQVGKDQFQCRMIIAADGRNSPLRQGAGIGVKTWRYGQRALAFAVRHELPHENISTEIHRTGGPFTTVPLPDKDGQHFSSIVWMETSQKAGELHAMDEARFNEALNARSCDILGKMTVVSARNLWPIISQKADCLIAPRMALIAEAAHVVPPIGAQGLNMSLADIECLLSLAEQNPDNLGSQDQLEAYQKTRAGEINLRVRGVDALNRAAMAESANLRDLRLKGLQFLHGLVPLRKTLMRKGLG